MEMIQARWWCKWKVNVYGDRKGATGARRGMVAHGYCPEVNLEGKT